MDTAYQNGGRFYFYETAENNYTLMNTDINNTSTTPPCTPYSACLHAVPPRSFTACKVKRCQIGLLTVRLVRLVAGVSDHVGPGRRGDGSEGVHACSSSWQGARRGTGQAGVVCTVQAQML